MADRTPVESALFQKTEVFLFSLATCGRAVARRVGAPVWESMAIVLITGPANAGKARVVLDAVRARAAREEEPWLVVPTHRDVERYRRELAEDGLVMGVRVERFHGLLTEVVRRAGIREPPLSALARERALARVAARTCSPSELAERPGFVRALVDLVGELEVERVTPARLRGALQTWAGEGGATSGQTRAAELSALYEGYHELLGRLGRLDPDQRAARALDAIRRAPALWGRTPVLLYGFDDLTALQFDAIRTLGQVADAPVTVSLAYEPGRVAFAGRGGAFQTLRPWASEHRVLDARAEYYAPGARAALHRLERGLFESSPLDVRAPAFASHRADPAEVAGMVEVDGPGDGARSVDPAGAVRMLEGGSPRAELELVAGEIRALLDAGVAPGEIAVVHRSPGVLAELFGEVLGAFEIPFVLPLRLSFAHTALGGALCGLLAACTEEGRLEDLLAWLRAPGLLEHPELADRLEATARRTGVLSAGGARALWEAEQWPLQTLDHLRAAAERGPLALIQRTARELRWLFDASRRHTGAVQEDEQPGEARALAGATRALAELAELARVEPSLAPTPVELLALLRDLELPVDDRPGSGTEEAVAVLDPLALRARRVRALFLCGLQEGLFPAPPRPLPVLSEEERRALATASGLRLGTPEQALAAERYLFYAAVSRPQELLVLSWHTATEEGGSTVPSLFLDDVCDLFPQTLREQRARRPAGAARWPGPGSAPASWAARELALASPRLAPPALAPLADAQLLAELREDRLWSASSLKLWADCPVRWFVERLLRAQDLDPDPEPLARGGLAHAALRDTLAGLRERYGSARLTPERLAVARELVHVALARHAPDFPLSVAPERVPGVRRRLEADLERYLAHAAERESPLEPLHLELGFGFPEDTPSLPPLDLGDGVRLRGRIDRVDVGAGADAGKAVVYDYKGAVAPPADRWAGERSMQVALYMRAVEQLLGLRVVGGFYQPLSGRDLRARGVLEDDAGVGLECVRGDTRSPEDVQAIVDELLALARKAAAQADAGALEPRPDTCGFGDGGCVYPSICRCGR
jgi:ATP-dependent helicase/DNAse subunit B